jgi:hypothetical protein
MPTIDTTTTNTTFPPPPPPPAAAPGRGTAAVVIGIVLVVSGFLTAISGAVLLAIFGGGHALTSGNHTVSTPASAMVADLGHIDNIRGFEPLTGSPTLQLTAQNLDGRGVFVGVGHTADVERYLDGAAIARVADLDVAPFRLDTVLDAGSAVPGAPQEQSFWVASAQSGSEPAAEAQLNWAIDDGDYEVVMMNADGTGSVLTNASIGTSLPTSSGLWIVVLVIGGLTMLGGTALIVVGARQRTRR